jgi:hypothetical protein
MGRTAIEYRTTSKDTYNKFKITNPNVDVSYTDWCNILYTFNYSFRDYCLETGFKASFPYGFGVFCITKYKRKLTAIVDGVEKILLPINWKKTKEEGRTIYHMNSHTDGYKARWFWIPHSARFYKPDIWVFKPARISSRLIKHYIDNGYMDKYLQWKQ